MVKDAELNAAEDQKARTGAGRNQADAMRAQR